MIQDRVRIPGVSKWILVKDKKLRVNIQNETGVDAMIHEIPERKMQNSYYVLKLLCALEGNNDLLESYEKKGDNEDMGDIISRWGEEAEARGLARGEAHGRVLTEDRNNRLFAYLLRDGRLEEAMISTENPAVKEKLYKEYNIE